MLTIVIPTKNRAPFISRMLSYYSAVKCQFPIIIGDSSNEEHLKLTKRAIKTIGSQLKITHIVDSGAKDVQISVGWQRDYFLRNLINYVQTPYVAFYADDDFAIVNNLNSAIDFLESNKEYSFVCGEAIIFGLKAGVVYGEISGTRRYRQKGILHDLPSQRLLDLYSDYAVLEYGVSRTEQKKYRWNKIFESPINNNFAELLNCGLVVLQGKVKKMDELFIVRQGHIFQVSGKSEGMFDWKEQSEFTNGYSRLSELLTDELVSLEHGLSLKEAKEIVRKGFWSYLTKALMKDWREKRADKNISLAYFLMNKLRKSRSISQTLRMMRSFLPSGRMSLLALLRRTSPYYQDFVPIYKIVANQDSVLAEVNSQLSLMNSDKDNIESFASRKDTKDQVTAQN